MVPYLRSSVGRPGLRSYFGTLDSLTTSPTIWNFVLRDGLYLQGSNGYGMESEGATAKKCVNIELGTAVG